MQEFLEDMREMTVLNERVSLTSAMNENTIEEMDIFVDSILESMKEKN